MKQLLFALLFIPALLFAQEDQHYLAGAVPVADGKVVFTREINAPSLSKAQIYQQLLKWGQENFNTKESRVAYQNEAKGEIAIIGEEYIVFSSTALSLDRAMMKYRIIIECKEHACTLQLAGIRYEYNVSYQNEPEKYLAEEWITDEYALNKSKTKLNRISGKFRKATIDFADKTFDSATNTLGAQLLTTAPIEPVSAPQRETRAVAPMEGFVAFQADKIPSTILQMLPDNALQIKAVKGNTTDANVEWKANDVNRRDYECMDQITKKRVAFMKKILLLIYMMFPVLVMAQGHKGEVDECAPMKNGKVCYSDDVEIENTSKLEIFNAINAWAKKSYGKDVFLSNVNSNKNKGTIFVSSKVELLLNDTDKTIIKYKMRITCFDNRYTIEASDIVYQYDPLNDKKYKTYKAEDVIANNGDSNTIALIKDPKLFCNATFFFVENLFADVFDAAQNAESE